MVANTVPESALVKSSWSEGREDFRPRGKGSESGDQCVCVHEREREGEQEQENREPSQYYRGFRLVHWPMTARNAERVMAFLEHTPSNSLRQKLTNICKET